jgi:immune inhibitor A
MAAGGWLAYPGQPMNTCPAPLGAWEKWVLGWLDPVNVKPGEMKNNVLLRPAIAGGPADKVIKVNLPDYPYSVAVNQPWSGTHEWYSGTGDMLENTLTRSVTMPSSGGQLTFMTWYDTEPGYDYCYVETSVDGGTSWSALPIQLEGKSSTDSYLTGNSGSWIAASCDLSAPDYSGKSFLLRFRYSTDPAVHYLGWAVDDIRVSDVFDTVESGNAGWSAAGWSIIDGTANYMASHFYMFEWRVPVGFNVSMNNWYVWHWTYDPPVVQLIPATPGLLGWYRNTQYSDNIMVNHPGAGMLLAIDSHPDLLVQGESPWVLPLQTKLQMADATFAPWDTTPMIVTYYGTTASYGPLPGVPVFDDARSYYDPSWSDYCDAWSSSPFVEGGVMGCHWADNSVITPKYGLKVLVKDGDQTAHVNVDFRGYKP